MLIDFHDLRSKNTAFILCFLFIITCFFFPVMLTGCMQKMPTKETRTAFYLDTVISITLYDENPDALFRGCMELLDTYDNMLSRTKEGSDIWNINHSNGAPVTVSEDTAKLLSTALTYAEMSEGLVDPTIGTLSSLWNFGEDNQGIVPAKEKIREALSHVDYRNVIITGNQVTLADSKAMLDLGFIAKGFIADKIKEYLVSNQVTSAIINLGGNVMTIGTRPDGTPFRVGIQKPFADSGTAAMTLEIADKSLVSSGNYERYFMKDDVLYHHILSAKNGYPADSGLSSVTIISASSVDADALSTLCFLLGYEKGKKLIDSLPDVEAVFIDNNGNVL